MSGLDAASVLAALKTVFEATGCFDGVAMSQGVVGPSTGMSAQIWAVPPFKLVKERSGLADVSVLLTFNARMLTPIGTPPADDLDLTLLAAWSAVMNSLVGGFTLNGEVEQLDLLGSYSSGLESPPGYVEIAGTMYRCITMTLPLVLDSVWTEVP